MGLLVLVTWPLLLFPDGCLPSRRWRPVAGLLALAPQRASRCGGCFDPGTLDDIDGDVPNPLGIPGGLVLGERARRVRLRDPARRRRRHGRGAGPRPPPPRARDARGAVGVARARRQLRAVPRAQPDGLPARRRRLLRRHADRLDRRVRRDGGRHHPARPRRRGRPPAPARVHRVRRRGRHPARVPRGVHPRHEPRRLVGERARRRPRRRARRRSRCACASAIASTARCTGTAIRRPRCGASASSWSSPTSPRTRCPASRTRCARRSARRACGSSPIPSSRWIRRAAGTELHEPWLERTVSHRGLRTGAAHRRRAGAG